MNIIVEVDIEIELKDLNDFENEINNSISIIVANEEEIDWF